MESFLTQCWICFKQWKQRKRLYRWKTALFSLFLGVALALGLSTLSANRAVGAGINNEDLLESLNCPLVNDLSDADHSLLNYALGERIQLLNSDPSTQAQFANSLRQASCVLATQAVNYAKVEQWQNAQRLTELAIGRAQAIQAWDLAYRWQWLLGRIHRAQSNREKSIISYEAALQTIATYRSSLDQTIATYHDAQTSDQSRPRYEELKAFQDRVERVYREFADLLLSEENPNLSSLEKARQAVTELQVVQLETFLQQPCTVPSLEQLDQVVDQANSKTAFIFPIILDNRLEVILKLPQEPLDRYHPQPISAQNIEQIIKELKLNLEREYSFAAVKLQSKQIYDWLVAPRRRQLDQKGIKTIVFALDGALQGIPMASLYDGKEYLIENFAVATALGLQLPEPRPLSKSRLKVLAAGLAKESLSFSNQFAPLKYVPAELEVISDLPISKSILQDENFTSENFEQSINRSRFQIVHLATHGQFSSDPDQTFILTWDNRVQNLKLGELFQTRGQLQADSIELLVLNACETATGDKLATLGIAGTTVRAGADSAIASLWTVSDESSVVFTRELYKYLKQPGVSRAEALRRVQLFMLTQDPRYEHPRYWATYILVGSWL